MTRLAKITASALAVAALAPAAASANDLRGAPQMFRVDADTVQVKFVTDKKVARNGVRISIANLGSGSTVRANGRHGNDFRYVARINVDEALDVGTKYRVRFTIGDDAVTRRVLLRAAR